jgi:hypothetical protein
VLDARCPGPEEHLDAAVRAAASLTLELARRGGCRVLLPGDRRPLTVESNLKSWAGVHTRLALIERGADARAPALSAGARPGPVFYVAARPLDRVPAALTGAGRAPCVIVLPAGLAQLAATPTFEVSGCRGYALRARGIVSGERAA